MNVTIKLDDTLCREARHRAVDRGLSLSGWIAAIVSKELVGGASQVSLLEALQMEEGGEREFVVPRDATPAKDPNFA